MPMQFTNDEFTKVNGKNLKGPEIKNALYTLFSERCTEQTFTSDVPFLTKKENFNQ